MKSFEYYDSNMVVFVEKQTVNILVYSYEETFTFHFLLIVKFFFYSWWPYNAKIHILHNVSAKGDNSCNTDGKTPLYAIHYLYSQDKNNFTYRMGKDKLVLT